MDSMYSYKDIVLIPNYSEVDSRDSISTDVEFLDDIFCSPLIPANMVDVIDKSLTKNLRDKNMLAIMHRFGSNRLNDSDGIDSISVGVRAEDYELLNSIADYGLPVKYITIDVAHGHHRLVRDMIEHIKSETHFIDSKIIAGNVGTPQGAFDLIHWGADALKVGLSMGKSCSTYNATGIGTPMFSAVKEIAAMSTVPIIADGQIREPGDVMKALVAGATMVMMGSTFGRSIQSPAKRSLLGFGPYKILRGSSTLKSRYIEGTHQKVPLTFDTYDDIIEKYHQGIRSGMSYLGVNSINKIYELAADNWRIKT